MPQIGGKNAKKTSSNSKRHFTVVMENKENGLYISSSPSSAAKKAVTKLCTSNKSKKVEFHIREITQGSKKKTYGPYTGYIEKLKEPIELKGRVIRYKPVAKLSSKTGKKMKGGKNATTTINTGENTIVYNNLNYLQQKKKNINQNANKKQIIANAQREVARVSREKAIENQGKANKLRKNATEAKSKANKSEKNFSNLQQKYPNVKLPVNAAVNAARVNSAGVIAGVNAARVNSAGVIAGVNAARVNSAGVIAGVNAAGVNSAEVIAGMTEVNSGKVATSLAVNTSNPEV
jgi:hypothetical protein